MDTVRSAQAGQPSKAGSLRKSGVLHTPLFFAFYFLLPALYRAKHMGGGCWRPMDAPYPPRHHAPHIAVRHRSPVARVMAQNVRAMANGDVRRMVSRWVG